MITLRCPLALILLLAPACDPGNPPTDAKADETKTEGAKAEDGKAAKVKPAEAVPAHAKAAAEQSKATAAGEAEDAADDGEKDRGTATVTIGDTEWTAESCKARPRKNDALKITCSTVNMEGGKVDRVALDILLPAFKGPGDYKAGNFGTTFSGVGFEAKKATEGKDEDQAAKDAIKAGMKGATIHMLGGMPVTVTKADASFIDGTFSFAAEASMKTPAFKNGTFHAVMAEKK